MAKSVPQTMDDFKILCQNVYCVRMSCRAECYAHRDSKLIRNKLVNTFKIADHSWELTTEKEKKNNILSKRK